MEQQTFIVVGEDGQEIECNIVFTFNSEEYDKSYVIYQPVDAEDETVYVASYNENEGGLGGKLEAITDEEEWEMIEEVLGAFTEE